MPPTPTLSRDSSAEASMVRLEHRHSRTFQQSLGHAVVDADILRASGDIVDERIPPETYHENLHENVQNLVEEERGALARLSDKQKEVINGFFGTKRMPHWLKQATGTGGRKPKIVEALTKKDENGAFTVDTDTYLNVMHWHQSQLREAQEEFDKHTWESQMNDLRVTMERAILDGWMPADIFDRWHRLEATDVRVDDGVNTLIKDWAGFKRQRFQEYLVVLSPSHASSRHVFTHEMMHVLSDDGFDYMGLRTLFRGPAGRVLDEAITEHITSSLLKDHYRTVNPFHKVRKHDTYVHERELLDILCNEGVHKIDISVFMRAYFDAGNLNEEVGDHAGDELLAALESAFPFMDISNELSGLVIDKDGKYSKEQLKKIVNTVRNVVKAKKAHAKALLPSA